MANPFATGRNATFEQETVLRWRILLAAGVTAAALIGFGIVMWVAANWSDMGRMTRFALVGGSLAAGCLGAMVHSSARIPGALVAFMATGGFFALIGQTYQSDADPWELFALWAALGLPLAIAARHDALWTLWVVVAFTGVSLWAGTRSLWFSNFSASTILTTWTIAGLLLAFLYVLDRLPKPPGQARWAFRVGALLTIGMVTGGGLDALISSTQSNTLPALALAVLTLLAVAFYAARPMEFGLMSVAALALDVVLIFILARILLDGSGLRDSGAFLLLGLIAGGIVAGTAAILLRLPRPAAVTTGTDEQPAVVAASDTARAWPVTVLSGMGAVLSAVPILIFAAMTFGSLLMAWQVAIALGGTLLAASILLIRMAAPLGFRQQFGFITMVMAYALLIWGFANLTKSGDAALATAIVLLAGAVVTPPGWIRALLGGALAAALAIWIELRVLGVGDILRLRGQHAWLTLGLGAAGGLFTTDLWRKVQDDKGRRGAQSAGDAEARGDDLARSLLIGIAAMAIVALAATSGRTFLLGGASWGNALPPSGLETAASWSIWRIAGLFAGIGAFLLTGARGGPAARAPVAIAMGCAALVMSALTTSLGPVLLLMAVAFFTGHRVLAALAACAALWIVGAFYYWLGWTLTEKAYLLIGMGAALAVVAALSRRAASGTADASGLAPGVRAAFAIPLIAASGLATATIAGLGIRDKEAIIATGRPIYIALAPVDPRSLMQGDYMALRFQLPAAAGTTTVPEAGPPYGVATLDARGLATVQRVVHGKPPVAADEIALKLKNKNRTLVLGTDAWHFKEGDAKKFEAARFGAFRVGADGEMILVGMADKDLAAIR